MIFLNINTSQDMLDKGISIAIVLFLFSMISERIVTWFKLYFGGKDKALWLKVPIVNYKICRLFSTEAEDLTVKSNNPNLEKLREQKILGLNIVIGIILATASKADFFEILGSPTPYEQIGWSSVSFDKHSFLGCIKIFLGCGLTGLFISLGSKFWHDTLDMLFYAKNLKAKLVDSQTYEVTSINQLDEYLKFTESDLVKLALLQNEQVLKAKYTNINFLSDTTTIVEGERKDVLGIYIKDENRLGLPEQVPVKLPSGKNYIVKTEIISGLGIAKVRPTGGMDGAVANQNSLGYTGSACCIVTDDENKYLLTNCHVMTAGYYQNPYGSTGNEKVLYNGDKVGIWTYGIINNVGDFALVKLNEPEDFIQNSSVETFKGVRTIDKNDYLKLKLTVRGNISGTKTDAYVIDEVQKQVAISYKYGETIYFDNAVLIGSSPDKHTCNSVTTDGDSGGVAYDDNFNIVGIITGNFGRFSIIIPIQQFLLYNNLKIN